MLHEPWRDEANWWLLGRDYSWEQWLQYVRLAGSPPLWYLMVRALALSGLPVLSQQLFNTLFVISGVGLLAANRKVPLWLVVALTSSYVVSFDYSIVSRSYGLSFLAFSGVLFCRRSGTNGGWWGTAWLVVLALGSAHGLVLAASFGVVDAWAAIRRKALDPKLAVLLLVGLFAAYWTASGSGFVMTGHSPSFQAALESLGSAVAPLRHEGFLPALGALVLATSLLCCARSRAGMMVICVATAGLLAIFWTVHAGTTRHHGFLLLAWLGGVCLAHFEPAKTGPGKLTKAANAALIAMLIPAAIWSGFLGSRAHRLERSDPFSGGAEAAEWVMGVPQDVPLAVWDSALATSVLVHLPDRAAYQLDRRQWDTFLPEDVAYAEGRQIGPEELLERAAQIDSPVRPALLLGQPLPADLATEWGYVLIRRTETAPFGALDEVYGLYLPAEVMGVQ